MTLANNAESSWNTVYIFKLPGFIFFDEFEYSDTISAALMSSTLKNLHDTQPY